MDAAADLAAPADPAGIHPSCPAGLFRTAHSLERQGRWRDAVVELIRLSVRRPPIWPAATLEIDRLVRMHDRQDGPPSFSSSGLSPASLSRVSAQDLELPADLFIGHREPSIDVMRGSLSLARSGGQREALRWAFERAWGHEIEALDLLLARHFSRWDSLWVRFVNRYLQRSGLALRLANGDPADRFARLRTAAVRPVDSGPLVSVLMPVHNAEARLRQAADSILVQSWRRLELIIVDDASTDGSWALCQAIGQLDPRVRLHRNPVRAGPFVSRNIALALARGDYLTSQGTDDWVFPGRIERLVRLAVAAGGARQVIRGLMLRLMSDGSPARAWATGPLSDDGLACRDATSLFIGHDYFRQHLGAWDNVLAGADTELVERAWRAPAGVLDDVGSVTLRLAGTADAAADEDPERGMLARYRNNHRSWQASQGTGLTLAACPDERPFPADEGLSVEPSLLRRVYGAAGIPTSPLPASAAMRPASAMAWSDKGSTDHGERPHRREVLLAACRLAGSDGHDAAIAFAGRHLPADLRHTIEILQANAALARRDEVTWLGHINRYLSRYGMASISLTAGNSLLARLGSPSIAQVRHGPLVSVIMPAWNAQHTVEHAARSILAQSWRPLELIIVDDASTDDTWSVLARLAASDPRVRIRRNRINVGPYVSKNVALTTAQGLFITGHDADDWAHPKRIQRHVEAMLASQGRLKASLTYMLRLTASGEVTKVSKPGPMSLDGAARLAYISCLFETDALRRRLGFWDSVRFAADSEMIARAQACFGDGFTSLRQIGMLCLDLENSLTNHPVHGIKTSEGGLADSRRRYRDAFAAWHSHHLPHGDSYLPFPLRERRFAADPAMTVPWEDQAADLNADSGPEI